MGIKQILEETKSQASPARAKASAWFFKTGPGQYGEGDKFLGLTNPQVHSLVRKYKQLSLANVEKLLKSEFHEHRLLSLLILVHQFSRASDSPRQKIFNFYLDHTQWINNWDLVDSSAHKIVGEYLLDKSPNHLFHLAKSDNIWERRISVIASFAYINTGHPEVTLKLAQMLLHDPHDLIHKAVGWSLREVGKRCGEKYLIDFLDQHVSEMPRTTLRYAIERFPDAKRRYYMTA